jgi:hypothetical protein
MCADVVCDVAAQLLALGIEIRVVEIQKDLTLLNSSHGGRITGERRIQDWSSVSLKCEQSTVLRFARVKKHRLLDP